MTRDLVGKCLENPENHSKFLFFFHLWKHLKKKKKKNMRKKKNNFMCETDSFVFFFSLDTSLFTISQMDKKNI